MLKIKKTTGQTGDNGTKPFEKYEPKVLTERSNQCLDFVIDPSSQID